MKSIKVTTTESEGQECVFCPSCSRKFAVIVKFNFSAVCHCGLMLEIRQRDQREVMPVAGVLFPNQPFSP